MMQRAAELLVLHPAPHRRLLLEGHTSVGRRDDCDLRFIEDGVEPVHAVILPTNGEWILQSAAYLPCSVNGKSVVEAVLADRDVIQIGAVMLGFRLADAAASLQSLSRPAASLVALREDVAAERAMLAEERTLWEAELDRRRVALTQREMSYRSRASKTARAVHRERERLRKDEKRVADRAIELDRLAAKLAEQQRLLSFERTALGVEQKHADSQFQKIEERRGLVGREAEASAVRIAERKKELLKLNLEIERRRADLERYAAPDAVEKTKTLIEREFAAAARERDAEAALQELTAMFREVDGLLANLERMAAAAPPPNRLPALRIAPEPDGDSPTLLPMVIPNSNMPALTLGHTTPVVDLESWADDTRQRAAAEAWWDAREEEFQQSVREWREEKQALLADLHEKQHAVNAAKAALSEHELRVARETARERTAIHREREAVDRRRAWLDRAQQRYAALQTAALEARLRPDDPDALLAQSFIAEMKKTDELWQQFRCDVLRERLELSCERERMTLREQELVSLRRLAGKQRSLLASIVSDQSLRDRLWDCERQMKQASALEREAAIERLAFALLEDDRPRKIKPAASTEQQDRKAA
jgi:hypothetical protein